MFSEDKLIMAQNGDLNAMLDIANSYFKGADTIIDKNKAFYWYKKAFDMDFQSIRAINGLADCHRENKDYQNCVELYEKSAEQNDPFGITMLGHSYLCGIVYKTDFDKSIEYYEKAAKLNSLEAIDSLYDAYCEKYDKNIANIKYIEFLRNLAAENNALAMVRLFDIYNEEELVPKDENTALYYLEQAVSMECPRAITTLAVAYAAGNIELLGKDIDKANELLEKGADLNDEWALYMLAYAYANGTDGYERDIVKASGYYEKCIETGELFYSDSLCELGIELCDSRNSFYDLDRGINLLSEAAKCNNYTAANYLGHIYEDGFMVPQDIDKAIEYYKIAVEQDNPKAQYNLGRLLIDGLFGVPKDEKLAIDLFERAAQQGTLDAMEKLGICAYEGKGMPVDMKRARMLFEKCAREGLPQSQYDFALMNLNGNGGQVNYKAAEYWYNKVLDSNIDILIRDAKWALALMYSNDTKEYAKAFPIWTVFAKEGNAEAQYNLGLFYANGWAVRQDDNIAKYWIGKAAKQGLPVAMEIMNEIDNSDLPPASVPKPNDDSSRKEIPADIGVYKKITIFSSVFFIVGFVASYFIQVSDIIVNNILLSLLVAYLISVLPLSIMRLKGLKMSSGQAVMTATAGAMFNKESGCSFAIAFMLGRWLINYLISVITSPYWYIKSIVMLVKAFSQ